MPAVVVDFPAEASLFDQVVLGDVPVPGGSQERERHAARAAGFDLHLIKPGDPLRVLHLLAQPQGTRPPPDLSCPRRRIATTRALAARQLGSDPTKENATMLRTLIAVAASSALAKKAWDHYGGSRRPLPEDLTEYVGRPEAMGPSRRRKATKQPARKEGPGT